VAGTPTFSTAATLDNAALMGDAGLGLRTSSIVMPIPKPANDGNVRSVSKISELDIETVTGVAAGQSKDRRGKDRTAISVFWASGCCAGAGASRPTFTSKGRPLRKGVTILPGGTAGIPAKNIATSASSAGVGTPNCDGADVSVTSTAWTNGVPVIASKTRKPEALKQRIPDLHLVAGTIQPDRTDRYPCNIQIEKYIRNLYFATVMHFLFDTIRGSGSDPQRVGQTTTARAHH
jgi:hypothetical protein